MPFARALSILAPPASLVLSACAAPQEPPHVHPDWLQETAFEAEGKLGGCAVGDFDPSRPGSEIAVVAGDGRVIEVYADPESETGWGHVVLGELPGEAIQCALGDLLPDRPGLELVTVGVAEGTEDDGGAGLAVLWRPGADGDAWTAEPLLEDSALIHAVAIGDVDPARDGNEVLLAGFSGVVHVGGFDAEGAVAWEERSLAPDGPAEPWGNAKGAAVGLGGAVLACDSGALVRLARRDGAWTLDELARWDDAPLARVAADADGVLVCANDGVLRYRQVAAGGAVSSTTNAARVEDRLRGAVIADLDPTRAGDEWATADYDGFVHLVRLWERERDVHGLRHLGTSDVRIAADDDKFHHLAAGVLGERGTCLVAVGYSGRVIVVSRRDSPTGSGR